MADVQKRKGKERKKNKTAAVPQNVQSACPGRRVSCQRRQQMPEADSGMERLRGECRRCAVRHVVAPSSSRQEAGVQLQSILLSFKTAPPDPVDWRLAWWHAVPCLRHRSTSLQCLWIYGQVRA